MVTLTFIYLVIRTLITKLLLVPISIHIIVALFNILSAIFINRKVSRFNSEIKKSEIKFSRYNELQVEALKSIYNKLVDFHYSNSRLFYSNPESNKENQFKNRINEWIKCYSELVYAVNCERIFLPQSLKDEYRSIIKNFEIVKNILIDEKNNISDELEPFINIEHFSIDIESNLISDKLDKMNNEEEFIDFEKNIKQFRVKIEAEITKMG